MPNIPRTMSTQHPDNVRQPFFVDGPVIGGDDEIKEAFYSFSHLGVDEQLWDCEGKEVDNFVVKKLLSRYEDYFQKNRLGRDNFITLRGPNPNIEREEGKILIETLESIPRNFDVARHFYGEDAAPIFEIAIPMVSSAKDVIRVKDYYKKVVVGKKDMRLSDDSKISDWVGDFKPDDINVIPLIEQKDSMLASDSITEEYLKSARPEEYQRVWLARSDPALNYGSLGAVLINMVALQKLKEVEDRTSVDIYPIIGCGSVPFRGNFRPDNVQNCLKSYPSVQTFTLQSAFKYDYPLSLVRDSIEEIETFTRKDPLPIDEEGARDMIERSSSAYMDQVRRIAPIINSVASHVPKRRKRKLHIGLFGYAREDSGMKLPRAITFCASLYSLGIPPELLGLNSLKEKDHDFLEDTYRTFHEDMADSLRYLNIDNLRAIDPKTADELEPVIKRFDFTTDDEHKALTTAILKDFRSGNTTKIAEDIESAASLRNFLG